MIDFDCGAAFAYGRIRQHLQAGGQLIGALDMLIAAQAVSLNVALVTNNIGEFERVPELVVENWV